MEAMNAKFFSLCAGIFFLTSASALHGQTAETPNLAGAPPRFLNFVHVQLKPGRASAYASLEAAIVRGYNGAQVDIHWLCLQAITGPSGVLYLNFFNSFEEYEKIFATYGQALAKHPDLPDVPLIMDFAKSEDQQQIFKLIFARQVMGRPYLAPPGVPKDRAEALRTAFTDTMKDPDFLADAEKSQLEITPVTGAEVEKLVKELYQTPKALAAKAAEFIRH